MEFYTLYFVGFENVNLIPVIMVSAGTLQIGEKASVEYSYNKGKLSHNGVK